MNQGMIALSADECDIYAQAYCTDNENDGHESSSAGEYSI